MPTVKMIPVPNTMSAATAAAHEQALELAARTYCHRLGLDPDESVGHGPPPNEHGIAYAVLLHSPRWRLVIDQLRAALAMQDALEEYRSTVRFLTEGQADAQS